MFSTPDEAVQLQEGNRVTSLSSNHVTVLCRNISKGHFEQPAGAAVVTMGYIEEMEKYCFVHSNNLCKITLDLASLSSGLVAVENERHSFCIVFVLDC